MSRRTLLSADQRARLFAIPTDRAEMARHYVLGPEDLELVRSKRRAVNRLGFAVQLCLLRHPGQGLGPGEHPPAPMLAFVAGQLGVAPAAFVEYAQRDQTRREHSVELQAALGLRGFRLPDWRACLRIVWHRVRSDGDDQYAENIRQYSYWSDRWNWRWDPI